MTRALTRREELDALRYQVHQAETNIAWAERVGIPRDHIREKMLSLTANTKGALRDGPNRKAAPVASWDRARIRFVVTELVAESARLRRIIADCENADMLGRYGS